MGMKREAVQEERQRTKERDQSEVESTSSLHADMPVDRILEAEKRVECKLEHQGNYEVINTNIQLLKLFMKYLCTMGKIEATHVNTCINILYLIVLKIKVR